MLVLSCLHIHIYPTYLWTYECSLLEPSHNLDCSTCQYLCMGSYFLTFSLTSMLFELEFMSSFSHCRVLENLSFPLFRRPSFLYTCSHGPFLQILTSVWQLLCQLRHKNELHRALSFTDWGGSNNQFFHDTPPLHLAWLASTILSIWSGQLFPCLFVLFSNVALPRQE